MIVLICAFLEAISIGWIYGMITYKCENKCILFSFKFLLSFKGIPRLKKDLYLMRGSYPNIYWVVCYLVITPLVTIVREYIFLSIQ